MKKTVSVLVIAAIMLTVFFCIPVNAETEGAAYIKKNVFTNKTNNNVTIQIFCQTYYPEYTDVFFNSSDQAIRDGMAAHHVSVVIWNQGAFNRYIDDINYTFQIIFEDETTGNQINGSTTQIIDLNVSGSDDFNLIPYGGGTIRLNASSEWSYGRYICIPANTTLYGEMTFYTRVETSISSGQPNYDYIQCKSITMPDFTAVVTEHEPHASNTGIVRGLQELIDFFKGNSITNNNITSESGTLATQSDQVHSQEASYYQQNSDAIQATGLSNYQFDASAVSGLTGVRGDFIDVWNSLGSWNSIYIFSLTLGLALTILRHSPSAISSALNRKKYSKQGGKTP